MGLFLLRLSIGISICGLRGTLISSLVVVSWIAGSAGAAVFHDDWVTVGNPGNAHDPGTGSLYGAVPYVYNISKYEVTNNQYVEFLNAKAQSNALGLYDDNMTLRAVGGITRSSGAGGFVYSAKPGQGNKPVAFVNFFDALRYANWVNNGKGNGSTETGSYTLLGGTEIPANGSSITRSGATGVFLASQDEWYKAAYHQPASAGGDSDDYWTYPTRSNTRPASDQPPGDPSIASNVANYRWDDGLNNGYDDGFAVTGSNVGDFTLDYLTEVGAYVNAPSYYGTYDQAGNLYEWTDTYDSGRRIMRGGSYVAEGGDIYLQAVGRLHRDMTDSQSWFGFRLVQVPEPAMGLSVLGLGPLVLLRRKPR